MSELFDADPNRIRIHELTVEPPSPEREKPAIFELLTDQDLEQMSTDITWALDGNLIGGAAQLKIAAWTLALRLYRPDEPTYQPVVERARRTLDTILKADHHNLTEDPFMDYSRQVHDNYFLLSAYLRLIDRDAFDINQSSLLSRLTNIVRSERRDQTDLGPYDFAVAMAIMFPEHLAALRDNWFRAQVFTDLRSVIHNIETTDDYHMIKKLVGRCAIRLYFPEEGELYRLSEGELSTLKEQLQLVREARDTVKLANNAAFAYLASADIVELPDSLIFTPHEPTNSHSDNIPDLPEQRKY